MDVRPFFRKRMHVLKERRELSQREHDETLQEIARQTEYRACNMTLMETKREALGHHLREAEKCSKASIRRRDHEYDASLLRRSLESMARHEAECSTAINNLQQLLIGRSAVLRCRKYAVEAAEDAEQAISTCAALTRRTCGRSAYEAILLGSSFDHRGLPLSAVHMMCYLRNDLNALLTLAACSKANRALVEVHVTERLPLVDYPGLAGQRSEWPREPDSDNGIYRPLHYHDSVLAYAESPAAHFQRTHAAVGSQGLQLWSNGIDLEEHERRLVQADLLHREQLVQAVDWGMTMSRADICVAQAAEAWKRCKDQARNRRGSADGAESDDGCEALREAVEQFHQACSGRQQLEEACLAAKSLRRRSEAEVEIAAKALSTAENEVTHRTAIWREHMRRFENVDLPLPLKLLVALHPATARALPLRWSLHLLGGLIKMVDALKVLKAMGEPRVPIELIVRELISTAVPGSAEHYAQRGKPDKVCTCTQRARESYAAALDEGVTLATAYKVVHLVLTHPTVARPDGLLGVNQREWCVRPEFEWLTRSECSLGRRLANYALERAMQRHKSREPREAAQVAQAAQAAEAATEPAPYYTYVSAAHFLPGVARALGHDAALHTKAAKRKLGRRTAAHDPPVSPKRAITAWFTRASSSSSPAPPPAPAAASSSSSAPPPAPAAASSAASSSASSSPTAFSLPPSLNGLSISIFRGILEAAHVPLTTILPLQDKVVRVFEDCQSGRVSDNEAMLETARVVRQAGLFDAFKDGMKAAGLLGKSV